MHSPTQRFSRFTFILTFFVLLSACAQIPKESAELSTTVGRDIAAVHDSHRNLANALFRRMKKDINRFVDDVYAPYQIQFVLKKQKVRQAAGNRNNLFSVIDNAMRNPEDVQAQKDAILFMEAAVEAIYNDVENYRSQRLEPILEQEHAVTGEIERAYDQIERGNATVTAYLASVVKVNEAQDQLLKSVDMEGLREKIGVALSNTSDRVSEFVEKAKKVEGSVDSVSGKIGEWTEKLDKLTKGD